jgi:hypothetical protein
MKNTALNAILFVHQHIFGNAGEFVDQYLHASFANEWRQIDLEFPENKYLSSADLLALTADGCRLRACSTMYPVSIDDESRISSFVLLADPIVRAKQVFLRVAGDSTQPNSELAREQGFRGYVEWALGGGHGGVVICNYQTLHLSNVLTRELDIVQAVAGNQEFAEAMNYLGKVGVVGVADRPVCSIKKLQQTRSLCFPELQMDSLLRYFSGQNRPSIQAQRETIKNELGEALFERLVEANRLDTQIYQSVLKKFGSSDDALCLGHAASDQECGCLNAPLTSSHLAERPLFFLHIPKTAGTAFSLHLKNQFSHQTICPAAYWPDLLEIPNDQRVKYKLISGHFSDLARAMFEVPVDCLTVLREPVERVLSLLRYQNHLATGEPLYFSHASITELASRFREEVVKGFNAMLNTSDSRIIESLSNYQVRVISGGIIEPSYVLTRKDLDAAKRNIVGYKFLGLTERMQDSLDLLAYTFGWAPITNVVMNETPKNVQHDDISPDLIDRIIELNQLDIELYAFAKDVFEQRNEEMRTRLQSEFGCELSFFDKLESRYALTYEKAKSASLLQSLGDNAVGFGWYAWESNSGGGLRWTGPGPDSFLDLRVLKQHDLLISFRIAGYASEAIVASAIVSADGNRLPTQLVTGTSGEIFIQAVAGLSLLNHKLPFLRVGIHLMTTMSAKDINPAARNNRRLGLAIHALGVRPVGEGVAL